MNLEETPPRNLQALPLTPLSPQAKRHFFEKLPSLDAKLLGKALQAAALALHIFPEPMAKMLKPLQESYGLHQANQKVSSYLRSAIEAYIETQGLEQFQQLLQQDWLEKNWNTGFIHFLAAQLELELKVEPIVEMAIAEGKLYWHIIQAREEIYNRHKTKNQEFDFSQAHCIRLSMEQFSIIKNTGKRSGTVAITQKRFVAYFKPEYQHQAAAVWSELKSLGIINAKDRLSDAWRMVSDEKITLASLSEPKLIISREDVQDILKDLAGSKRHRAVARQTFIDKWDNPYQIRAGLIWDELKKQETINAQDKLTTLNLKLSDFLAGLHLDYLDISKALYEIANNQRFHEAIENFPQARIFRNERSYKIWEQSGRVINAEPEDQRYCTQLWEVSIYDDLQKHRNTRLELAQNQDHKLNYDHIPSSDALKLAIPTVDENLALRETAVEEKLQQLQNARTQHLVKRIQNLDHATRQQIQRQSDPILENMDADIASCKSEILFLGLKREYLKKEGKGHGLYWWVIAILEKLHKQGETFLQSSAQQQKSTEHPFLRDVKAYLDILEQRAEDFNLTSEDYLKALSAFRYLYRCQVKPTEPLAQRFFIGSAPQAFFSQASDLQTIDKFITERMQNFIVQREQMHCPTARKLNF